MDHDLSVMKRSALFSGIEETEISAMVDCLSAVRTRCKKKEFLFREGDMLLDAGLVLSGCLHVIREDFWGNRTILTEVGPGHMFGETYAYLQAEPLSVSVVAAEDTEVLLLNCHRVLNVCTSACVFHNRLIHNMVRIMAEKNLMLTRKMEHISHRTTREKLLSYLSEQSKRQECASFTIPFNRQQLADYLSVDRSAMSSELGKMKKEGLLDFEKNRFTLYLEKRGGERRGD